jgi:hypothetical protein
MRSLVNTLVPSGSVRWRARANQGTVCVPAQINRGFTHKLVALPSGACAETVMLETIAIILLILWALGLVTSYSMGGLIHILLVVAIVVVLIRVIQGRKITG